MTEEKKAILSVLTEYLEKNPTIRFGQALFNLGINEFQNKDFPDRGNFLLRDIYNDSDEKISMRVIEALSKMEK